MCRNARGASLLRARHRANCVARRAKAWRISAQACALVKGGLIAHGENDARGVIGAASWQHVSNNGINKRKTAYRRQKAATISINSIAALAASAPST